MTERGLPSSDGAPACPFVAFEDDRDERASSPDHRHRCYAEPTPAPRALAHQEAYCLSSAFPVCPTFQDWARREAAQARGAAASARASESGAGSEPVQRNPPRNWQAPPPWVAGDPPPGLDDEVDDRWERDEDVAPPASARPERYDERDETEEEEEDLPAQGRGLSGSYADRVAAGGAAPAFGGTGALGASSDEGAQAQAGMAAYGDTAPPPPERAGDAPADWRDQPPSDQPVRPRRERDPEKVAAFQESHAQGRPAPPVRERERRRDPGAPEWERARTMEAYPTLRARRLPELSVPPILVSVIALALAAAVLFALPGLLGFGNPGGGAQATPTRDTTAATPAASLAPTPVPEPTQRTYVVKDGDTLSSIARRFDVTLDELIAANAETIPDPDKLAIGDVLIIPTGSDEDDSET